MYIITFVRSYIYPYNCVLERLYGQSHTRCFYAAIVQYIQHISYTIHVCIDKQDTADTVYTTYFLYYTCVYR